MLAVTLNNKSLVVILNDSFSQKIKNLAIFISKVAKPTKLSFLNPSPQYRAIPIKKISFFVNFPIDFIPSFLRFNSFKLNSFFFFK